jgi:A/G-specific adenine glycosylase
VREHDGRLPGTVEELERLPGTVEELERLPGIGKYTARAVASFAYGVQFPVVDTNVRRVLSSFIGRELCDREVWEVAHLVLPEGRAADWNGALMDYGALVQKASPRRTGKSSEPFASTNRFWRGRIIDTLRSQGRVSMEGLLDALPYPNRDEERVRGLVRALHEEGMVAYDAGEDTVELPA